MPPAPYSAFSDCPASSNTRGGRLEATDKDLTINSHKCKLVRVVLWEAEKLCGGESWLMAIVDILLCHEKGQLFELLVIIHVRDGK